MCWGESNLLYNVPSGTLDLPSLIFPLKFVFQRSLWTLVPSSHPLLNQTNPFTSSCPSHARAQISSVPWYRITIFILGLNWFSSNLVSQICKPRGPMCVRGTHERPLGTVSFLLYWKQYWSKAVLLLCACCCCHDTECFCEFKLRD